MRLATSFEPHQETFFDSVEDFVHTFCGILQLFFVKLKDVEGRECCNCQLGKAALVHHVVDGTWYLLGAKWARKGKRAEKLARAQYLADSFKRNSGNYEEFLLPLTGHLPLVISPWSCAFWCWSSQGQIQRLHWSGSATGCYCTGFLFFRVHSKLCIYASTSIADIKVNAHRL